jgi:hypothetical protein
MLGSESSLSALATFRQNRDFVVDPAEVDFLRDCVVLDRLWRTPGMSVYFMTICAALQGGEIADRLQARGIPF